MGSLVPHLWGFGVSAVLMVVVTPTRRDVERVQAEINRSGGAIDLMSALSPPGP